MLQNLAWLVLSKKTCKRVASNREMCVEIFMLAPDWLDAMKGVINKLHEDIEAACRQLSKRLYIPLPSSSMSLSSTLLLLNPMY
ncbi:hypothetical protein BDL97_01G117900 [Sphagnum fallax]|nr:hypothetical protein BDL97_01G117900 [Sphagnum fallax]KAH8974753.1 hypothetical protein BDL97_01G117900 [Sphagnum fallax]